MDIISVIFRDLCTRAKLPLFFLFLIVVSAMMILWSTSAVRVKINQREELILEQDALQIEWNNLILEENVLADPTRIQRIAQEKLGMNFISPKQEVVVIKKESFEGK